MNTSHNANADLADLATIARQYANLRERRDALIIALAKDPYIRIADIAIAAGFPATSGSAQVRKITAAAGLPARPRGNKPRKWDAQ